MPLHLALVREVPKAAVRRCSNTSVKRSDLLDHLVSPGEHCRGNCKVERLCSLEIDHQFVPGRRLHWKVTRLLALEDAIDIARRPPELVDIVRPIRVRPPAVTKKRLK